MLKKVLAVMLFVLFVVFIITSLFMFKHKKEAPQYIRSVTAIELKEGSPLESTKLTGVVKAWKEENLSFEVPGRIDWVIEKGIEVHGAKNAYTLAEDEGETVATLAPEEYELKLKAAKANVATAKAKVDALRVTINEVLTRQLDAAKAGMENAEKEYSRLKKLLEKDAVSVRTYDEAVTAYKKNLAGFSEINAMIKVRKAELKGLIANLEQLEQAAEEAKLNTERTELKVPYRGVIADVYENVGSNVTAGQKVVQLVVMDPIIVDLNISPQLDRKLHYCQFVSVYPPDNRKPVSAMINRKATMADPNTHTFNLELLVRNRFENVADNIPEEILALPKIKGTWPLTKIDLNGKEELVVISECLHKDEHGTYLWKIEETDKSTSGAAVYRVEKVYVKVLPEEYVFLGVYKYRVIEEGKDVEIEDFIANGVPDDIKTGDEVVSITRLRAFRPGDLVKVVLSTKEIKSGIYIPMKIVSGDSAKYWVYKVVRLKDGSTIAKQVFIEPKELYEDMVRIESPELKEGDQLVFDGTHFLMPNEKINIKSIEKIVL